MTEVISKEKATEEISSWMDSKKIIPGKRESFKDHIETLVQAVMYGMLSVNDDNTLSQKLLYPVGENNAISELVFKSRLNRQMITPHMAGVKSGDNDARIIGYMAALTGKNKAILSVLDSEDQRIADSIVVFFVG